MSLIPDGSEPRVEPAPMSLEEEQAAIAAQQAALTLRARDLAHDASVALTLRRVLFGEPMPALPVWGVVERTLPRDAREPTPRE